MYLCRFAGAEYRRSVGLLTNVHSLSSDMYLGWPSLNTRDGVLHYSGPLPVTCACTKVHESLRGLAKKGGFKSFSAQSLGSRFWARILGRMQVSQLHAPLWDGAFSGQSSSAGSTYAGAKVPYGFALSAAPESAAALYEAWKGNTLTSAILRDYSSARLDNFFESRALARDAVALFSLLSSACVFLSSRQSSGLLFLLVVTRCALVFLWLPSFLLVLRFPARLRILRDFLQLLAGRRLLRTVRHLEMARFPPSLFSQLARFRSSLFSAMNLPHWIQTNWILLGWWHRYLVLGL